MIIRIISLFVICSFFFTKAFSQSAFYNMGRSYADKENYEEAIRLTKLAMDMDSNDLCNLISDYCALSEYYSYTNEVDSCKSYSDMAMKMSKQDVPEYFLDVLQWISHSLSRVGFHQEAIAMRKEIYKRTEEEYGPESPLLVRELRLLSIFSLDAGDYKKAIEYAENEEELSYKIKDYIIEDNDLLTYDQSCGWLRYVLLECEEPIPAIYYLLQLLNIRKEGVSKENREDTLSLIWRLSRENEFLEGCYAVYKERLLHGTYEEKLTNLINIYAEDENIGQDVHAAEYVDDLYKLIINDELTKYFNEKDISDLLFVLQGYYSKINLIEKSLEIGKINLDWRSKHGLDPFGCDVRVLIFASNDDNEAEYAAKLGENIIKSCRYIDEPDIMRHIYESMAEAYCRIGDEVNHKKYIDLLNENEDFDSLYAQASIHLNSRNIKDLLAISRKLASSKDVPQEKRDLVMSWLMMSARNERNDSVLLSNIREYLNIYRNYILTNIPLMSEQEQASFFQSGTYNSYSLFSDYAIGFKDFAFDWVSPKEAYDYALLSKSILLTSQNEFRDIIKNSSDPTIIDKWNQFQQQEDAFSLQSEILKRDLIRFASQNSNYLKQLSYTWEDVQNALKEEEVAVEFIHCLNFEDLEMGNANPMYVALVVKKDYTEPIPIVLGPSLLIDIINDNEGIDALDNFIYYQTFWFPLEPYLTDAKTVYFSPTEQLNFIPIEYVNTLLDERACDIWNLVRVTSTREIISRDRMNKKENAILYGGLNYNIDKDELIYQSRKGNYHPTSALRAVEMENLRYGVKDLPGSLIEVKEIAKYFPMSPQVITGISGTEESFKALASSSMDIIHLATHGFFWNEEDVEKRDYVNFLNTDEKVLTKEENAMLRSGLIFSGANIGLMGESLPDDVEDGVLTALELSNLNLGNVDLVVMSACESGLGEISSDGVFGLQRGFKLAGTNSLLMSLWKVDDKATQKLMTEFYKNYLGGMSKQESFHKAQRFLRNDPEYSDPKYWAAFILLDALN